MAGGACNASWGPGAGLASRGGAAGRGVSSPIACAGWARAVRPPGRGLRAREAGRASLRAGAGRVVARGGARARAHRGWPARRLRARPVWAGGASRHAARWLRPHCQRRAMLCAASAMPGCGACCDGRYQPVGLLPACPAAARALGGRLPTACALPSLPGGARCTAGLTQACARGREAAMEPRPFKPASRSTSEVGAAWGASLCARAHQARLLTQGGAAAPAAGRCDGGRGGGGGGRRPKAARAAPGAMGGRDVPCPHPTPTPPRPPPAPRPAHPLPGPRAAGRPRDRPGARGGRGAGRGRAQTLARGARRRRRPERHAACARRRAARAPAPPWGAPNWRGPTLPEACRHHGDAVGRPGPPPAAGPDRPAARPAPARAPRRAPSAMPSHRFVPGECAARRRRAAPRSHVQCEGGGAPAPRARMGPCRRARAPRGARLNRLPPALAPYAGCRRRQGAGPGRRRA
jgi:hypothetical protein